MQSGSPERLSNLINTRQWAGDRPGIREQCDIRVYALNYYATLSPIRAKRKSNKTNPWMVLKYAHTFFDLLLKDGAGLSSPTCRLNSVSYFVLNWRITAFQCCVGFCCTTTWISHMRTYTPCLFSLPSTPSHPTPLGHHKAPSWTSCAIQHFLPSLYMLMYICFRNASIIFLILYLINTVGLISIIFVTVFLFVARIICLLPLFFVSVFVFCSFLSFAQVGL